MGLSTPIRGQIIPTRNKLQKIIMRRVTISQYGTGDKNNAHLLSHNPEGGGTLGIFEPQEFFFVLKFLA